MERYKYLWLQQVWSTRLVWLSILFLVRGYDVQSFDDSVYGNFRDFDKSNLVFKSFLNQIRKIEAYAYFFERKNERYATIYIFYKPEKLWEKKI